MLRRHVERFEVVVVVFELRSLDDEKPEAGEDGLDLFPQDREGMPMADSGPPAWQRDVDGAFRPPAAVGLFEGDGQPRLDILFELIRELTQSRPFLSGRAAERLQQRRHEPALPRQVPIADYAQLGLGRCSGDFPFELGAELFDLAGGIAHELRAVVNVASATFTTTAG
jgi:hypothetical protein